ncbi:hypothetical protein [Parathalassolituus penaei]|uniref:Chalcone isomerase domain-containing protein n=1 Tax=Parathalassolituus penaei TaxID=2997323 RepID=A0A9X3ISG2_9GAMM|nr:hypothetical protein [Parathalassolituus penaei]MCY0964118.1 hypothetical protein [Parathalassolituus penaei]
MKHVLTVLLCVLVTSVADAKSNLSIGSFEILDKEWFVVSLSQSSPDNFAQPRVGTLFEMKALADDISPRRFRQLWQDALAVNESADIWHKYSRDFDLFFQVVQAPLIKGDHLVLEQGEDSVVVSVNHYEHARLSAGFLGMVLQTLTARIAPIPELKQGLLAQLPEAEQKRLSSEFSNGEVSLQRIGETARWLRFPKSTVSQL